MFTTFLVKDHLVVVGGHDVLDPMFSYNSTNMQFCFSRYEFAVHHTQVSTYVYTFIRWPRLGMERAWESDSSLISGILEELICKTVIARLIADRQSYSTDHSTPYIIEKYCGHRSYTHTHMQPHQYRLENAKLYIKLESSEEA